MKDIKYDSDLNTDIHFLNEDFPKLRRKSLKNGFISSSTFTIIMTIYILITNMELTLTTSIAYFVINCLLGCSNFIISGKRFEDVIKLGKLISEVKVAELIQELSENNVEISKENLMNCEINNKREFNLVDIKDNELAVCVIETNSFYLLDNQEKIRVLKQIRKTLLDGRDNPSEVTLHLLEDHEVEKEEIPFKKKLTKK